MDTINYCSLLFEVKDQTDINSEANVRNISKFPKAESPNFLFRWWVNIVNVSKFLLQLKQLQDLSSGEFRTSMQRIYFLQVPTVDASWPVLELSKLQYSRMSSCWCPKLHICFQNSGNLSVISSKLSLAWKQHAPRPNLKPRFGKTTMVIKSNRCPRPAFLLQDVSYKVIKHLRSE